MLGTTLATLADLEGLGLAQTPQSFIFHILIAHSCREGGAILVSNTTRDLERIARVFSFEFVAPLPRPPSEQSSNDRCTAEELRTCITSLGFC
jgi:hypothetical protein